MNVRNFYVTADIEGRSTPLAGGPRNRNGNMLVTITQRSGGVVIPAFTIESHTYGDALVSLVYDSMGNFVSEFKTRR